MEYTHKVAFMSIAMCMRDLNTCEKYLYMLYYICVGVVDQIKKAPRSELHGNFFEKSFDLLPVMCYNIYVVKDYQSETTHIRGLPKAPTQSVTSRPSL